MSATVRTPSQRLIMAPALLLSLTMPSGYRSTCASCAGSHCRRMPWAIAGRAVAGTSVTPSLRTSVRHGHGVVHLPEHVELELQDLERALLRGVRAKALEGEREPELDVA